MKLYHRVHKVDNRFVGVECFFKTKDLKEPKKRVALIDTKYHTIVNKGTCRCGGNIAELTHSPINWTVCLKCGKDCSIRSYSRRLVGWGEYLS